MDIFSVSYATIKSEATNKGLRFYFTELFASDGITEAGYNVFAMSPFYGLTTTILTSVDPADVTDFDTNVKSTATSVPSTFEAQALASLPQVQSLILPGNNSGRSFGYTGTAAAASKVIRATVYTAPGANGQRSIVSTSASDAAAGVGARTVKITYMDQTGAGPFTETITLNGTTAVNTVGTNIAFIERIDVLTVGTTGSNVGTINLQTLVGGGGTTVWSIAVGDNQTNGVHHYVPVGKTCFVLLLEGAATVTAGQLSINVLNPINAVVAQTQPDTTIRHALVHVSRSFPVPLSTVGPSLIFMNTRPDAATASTTFAGFHWIQQ